MPSPCLSQAGDARGTAPKPRTRQVCCRYSFLFGIPSVWGLAAACQAGRHQTNAAIVSPVSAKVKDSFPQTGGLTAQGFPPSFIYPAQNPVNFSLFSRLIGSGSFPAGGRGRDSPAAACPWADPGRPPGSPSGAAVARPRNAGSDADGPLPAGASGRRWSGSRPTAPPPAAWSVGRDSTAAGPPAAARSAPPEWPGPGPGAEPAAATSCPPPLRSDRRRRKAGPAGNLPDRIAQRV